MKKKMFYKAGRIISNNTTELTNQPSEAQRVLWEYLRTKPKGFQFRRQHPVANYILDFYCHALKLAIAADGVIDDNPEAMLADIKMQHNLEAVGVKFIRFTNDEIMEALEAVIEKIDDHTDECVNKIEQTQNYN